MPLRLIVDACCESLSYLSSSYPGIPLPCVATLLIATALLATANAAPEFNINSPAFNPSLIAAHHDVSAQRLLRVHYTGEAKNNEERGISTFVEKAKSILSSSKISEKTLERWVRNKKSPGKALIRLKLHKTGGKLFENPQFNTWVAIVKRTNPHNPEAAMMSALMGRYSDDVLSQAIIAAKKVPGTKDLASKLQIEQTVAWLKKGKSSDDVFNLLQLKTAGKQIFDNPQFTVWTKYVDDLSKNDADKADLTMLSTLGAHYSDDVITKMIQRAKKVPSTESIAMKLENAQPQYWLSKNKTPLDAFTTFGLKADESLLTNVKLNLWVKYLDDFNTKNPKQKTTMVQIFTTKYGEEGLSQMLKKAKEVGTTEKMAFDLQKAQLVRWTANKTLNLFSSCWVQLERRTTAGREHCSRNT
ncbi:unnamed protein product [Phytophthora fragariaefolia]|uniref:RxLR effector protein n=1 Tax=Phytophthora fragariaefolia TaxID=1490495 RepID=A0A9W6X8A4_9STRA|nr:unnamed protein product [Phytophthora fragariaefolia]